MIVTGFRFALAGHPGVLRGDRETETRPHPWDMGKRGDSGKPCAVCKDCLADLAPAGPGGAIICSSFVALAENKNCREAFGATSAPRVGEGRGTGRVVG